MQRISRRTSFKKMREITSAKSAKNAAKRHERRYGCSFQNKLWKVEGNLS